MPSGENVSKCFRSFKATRRFVDTDGPLKPVSTLFEGRAVIARVLGDGVPGARLSGGGWVSPGCLFSGFFIKASQVGNRKVWPRVSLSVHQSLSLGDEKRMPFSFSMAIPSLPLSGCLWVKCVLSRHRWATYSLPGPVCSSDVRFCMVSLLALWVCLFLKMFSGFVWIMIYLMV